MAYPTNSLCKYSFDGIEYYCAKEFFELILRPENINHILDFIENCTDAENYVGLYNLLIEVNVIDDFYNLNIEDEMLKYFAPMFRKRKIEYLLNE